MTFNASRRESTELTQTPTSFESSRNTSSGAIISNSLSKDKGKGRKQPGGFLLIYTARSYKTSIRFFKPSLTPGIRLVKVSYLIPTEHEKSSRVSQLTVLEISTSK